jgi:hypothetical protein
MKLVNEEELIDEYTELYFEIKNEERYENIYNCRCRRRYNRKREKYNCYCKESKAILEYKRRRLKHISNTCFNRLESIIPSYYIEEIIRSKKGRDSIIKSYDKYITKNIEDCIDCDLMDCKNIAPIIYSYAKT